MGYLTQWWHNNIVLHKGQTWTSALYTGSLQKGRVQIGMGAKKESKLQGEKEVIGRVSYDPAVTLMWSDG